MEIHIGWPEGIYLALNILCMGYVGAEKGASAAIGYGLAWLFITLPLLVWGGFFA